MSERFEKTCKLVEEIKAESPPYLEGKQWYDREEVVANLKKMNYCEVIAQELADWHLRHIQHAFNRGVFAAINHVSSRLEQLTAQAERIAELKGVIKRANSDYCDLEKTYLEQVKEFERIAKNKGIKNEQKISK